LYKLGKKIYNRTTMLSRFVNEDALSTWSHFFFGLLLTFLSVGLLIGLTSSTFFHPTIVPYQILGAQTVSNDQAREVPLIDLVQNLPPSSELTLRNDNGSLIVTVGLESTQFARIPRISSSIEDLLNTQEHLAREVFASSPLNIFLTRFHFQAWPQGRNSIAFSRNNVVAVTPYPMQLNPSQLSLKIVTPDGPKQILYYPDSVWSYLSSSKVITEGIPAEKLLLDQDNDDVVYKLRAKSSQLMFAILPYNVCRNVVISAQTQEIKSVKPCSAVDMLADSLSITL